MSLSAHAQAVLLANDCGEYTIPARGLYPHQWDWDSALISLGWATIDPDRAWRELECLYRGQHRSGRVPHISFHPEPQAYFPGPEWWGDVRGVDGRRGSLISQPPLAATCLRLLVERAPQPERLPALVAAIDREHAWWQRERSAPHGEPVVVHPWETGCDNAPAWDAPLTAVAPTRTPFSRLDTRFVDASERPTNEHYERYIALVEWLACHDPASYARQAPFRVCDVGLSSLLLGASDDLAALAEISGQPEIAHAAATRSEQWRAALAARGSGLLTDSWDLSADRSLPCIGASVALQAMRPDLDHASWRALDALLTGPLASPYGVRTCAPDEPLFQPGNYWRGPVWSNITWLCGLGAQRAGEAALAARMFAAQDRAVRTGGFHEYHDADDGRGLGTASFSWTAALWLWQHG